MAETVESEDVSCNEDESDVDDVDESDVDDVDKSDVDDIDESDDDVCAQWIEASCTFVMYLHATGEAPMPSTRRLHGFSSEPMVLARQEVIRDTSAPSSNKRAAVLDMR